MNKADAVIYIDAKSREHLALVTAVNIFHPTVLSLAYVDESADERENVIHVSDVPYIEDASKQETNAELPTIHLNAWKARYEIHSEPASDHPMFDHPFAEKPTDDDGRAMAISRPMHEAMVAGLVTQLPSTTENPALAQEGALPSAADLDAVAAEQKAADDTAK